MKFLSPIAILIAICFCGISQAAPLAVTNASFEDNLLPDAGGNNWADGIPNGWQSENGVAGTPDPTFTVDTAVQGNGLLFHELSSAIGPATGGDGANYLGFRPGGWAYQDLGVPFAPNTMYTVDLLVDRRGAATTTANFGIAAALGTTLGTAGAFDTATMGTSDVFQPASVVGTVGTFTTGNAVPLGNVWVYVNGLTGNSVIDLVSVDASPVPEPSAFACLITLMMGLGFIVRKKR